MISFVSSLKILDFLQSLYNVLFLLDWGLFANNVTFERILLHHTFLVVFRCNKEGYVQMAPLSTSSSHVNA